MQAPNEKFQVLVSLKSIQTGNIKHYASVCVHQEQPVIQLQHKREQLNDVIVDKYVFGK